MTVVGAGVPLVPATLPVTPEPEFPIRLIALDIDGTIIGDDHEIAERTIEAVRRAMELDVAVSLVTGRMVSSAMRFASELGLTGPLVGYQGGLIRAMPSPGRSSSGRAPGASTRTSTTSSDSSCAPTTRRPTTTRRSWARGPSSYPTCSRRSTIR